MPSFVYRRTGKLFFLQVYLDITAVSVLVGETVGEIVGEKGTSAYQHDLLMDGDTILIPKDHQRVLQYYQLRNE